MPDAPVDTATPAPAGSPPLQGDRVAFTGTLASMTHRQAFEVVEDTGGTPTAHVSRQTTLLVVGEEGWPLEPDGKPSQKLQQAQDLVQQGHPLRILPESDWLHLVGIAERRTEAKRLYTPATLSKLLDVTAGTIRAWERVGLITAVRKVYRLPYFDFEEVTAARRLTDLLASGVPRREIESSLNRLRGLLPGIERPLAQLEILARDTRLLYRDPAGLVEPASGQRVFDFDTADEEHSALAPPLDKGGPRGVAPDAPLPFPTPPPDRRVHWTAGQWFDEGCRLSAEDDTHAAVEAFRLSLMQRPGDPETNFQLAETLYRLGNTDGALERYYAAVEADHEYIEVWTQIACLHLEKGDPQTALQALDVALGIHPDYPDARLHRAEALDALGRPDEAADDWRAYLDGDPQGPWADRARQRLGVE